MEIKLYDTFGLSEAEKAFIIEDAQNLNFDFIAESDKLEITISKHEFCSGEKFHAEFDVFLKGFYAGEETGYFGYNYDRELLHSAMS